MSHRRAVEDRRRLKKLAATCRWFRGAYYSDIKDRYYRLYTSDWGSRKYVRWLKRHCNRRVRIYPDLLQRGQYRKVSEFWYQLF